MHELSYRNDNGPGRRGLGPFNAYAVKAGSFQNGNDLFDCSCREYIRWQIHEIHPVLGKKTNHQPTTRGKHAVYLLKRHIKRRPEINGVYGTDFTERCGWERECFNIAFVELSTL